MNHLKRTMKRSFFYGIAFLLATTSTLFAQQRWSAGPRAGLNLSNFIGDVNHMKFRPGVSVGGFVMYSDINHFGVSADVLYSQKGTIYKNNDQSVLNYKQHLNYLEVPILFRYFLNKSGNFRPNLFVGPNVGFKLNAKRLNETIDPREFDNGAAFRPIDLGATFGLSLNFRAGQAKRLHIDARYTLGLADIAQSAIALPTPDGNIRNSTLSLMVGYGFGVGQRHPSRR